MAARVEKIITADKAAREIAGKENAIPGKKEMRGLKELGRLAAMHSAAKMESDRRELENIMVQVAEAIANNHRPSIPSYVGLPDLPFRFLDALRNPVAKGRKRATNVAPSGNGNDEACDDPRGTSYWRRPRALTTADLYAGFGRRERPNFESAIWTYAGPKKSGQNPGMKLERAGQRVKVKLAEARSEPFIARIFGALGYYVDPTDYARLLRIKYDRRLFSEFNRKPDMTMKIGLFFVPIYTIHLEREYDPFAFIDHAVFTNGKIVSGAELRRLLLKDPDRKGAEAIPENYNADVEEEMDHLVTREANVQLEEEEDSHSIGPWDFGGLGREHFRELRGAGVLAAWLGWGDSRFENTRLRIVETGDRPQLIHFFSDLGSGLGHCGGTFQHSSEDPNDFSWSFTRREKSRRNGRKVARFEIVDYEPIDDTPAFREITLDDARWMARLIGALTEKQIIAALIASGFESAEVRIYAEKLLARRDQLIRDVGLESEIAPLRPSGANRGLAYDPRLDGPVEIPTGKGSVVRAATGSRILKNGRIEERPQKDEASLITPKH